MKVAHILFFILYYSLPGQLLFAQINDPFEIPVIVIKYFPVDGDKIDKNITGDFSESLEFTRVKTDSLTQEIVQVLEKGSTYHGYKDSTALPSLKYKIIQEFEYLKPLPVFEKKWHNQPMTDYKKLLEKTDIKDWVEVEGVKEIWIWGYHGGVIDLWESNMSSPFGDVSNSDRDESDLPVFNKTYTVYHYNYQRGLSEAIEDHMHQIEALLNNVDGRDTTSEDEWDKLLFWGKFVGSDKSHKIITPHCGWAHYPPNGEKDYDWKNKNFVWTDIENWNPEGTGEKIYVNCERWKCNSLDWFIYWMQNLPGRNNGLSYNKKPLTNWWIFVGDYDYAKKSKTGLVIN